MRQLSHFLVSRTPLGDLAPPRDGVAHMLNIPPRIFFIHPDDFT